MVGQRGFQVVFPAGRFRFNDIVNWKSGVGVAGPGFNQTILLPYGRTVIFRGASVVRGEADFDTCEDCYFRDFTEDSINQDHTVHHVAMKAFYIQNARRMRIENVHCYDSWATQIGNDRLFDSLYVNCVSKRGGRGKVVYGGDNTATGAGIGMATGFEDTESLQVINCEASDNFSHGFFTEKSDSSLTTTRLSKGNMFIGCVAKGNTFGLQDSGSVAVGDHQYQVGRRVDGVYTAYASLGNSLRPPGTSSKSSRSKARTTFASSLTVWRSSAMSSITTPPPYSTLCRWVRWPGKRPRCATSSTPPRMTKEMTHASKRGASFMSLRGPYVWRVSATGGGPPTHKRARRTPRTGRSSSRSRCPDS
jgi:hypothetical protein